MTETKYKKYVVVSPRMFSEMSYSTEMGDQKALKMAENCAKHPSTGGRVYGETPSGQRAFISSYEDYYVDPKVKTSLSL